MTDPTRETTALEALLGVRVFQSPWVETGTMVLIGSFDKPEGWKEMTGMEQATYAIAHGATVVVQDIGDIR